MDKASPVEMRKVCELADALKQAGILFVPIPVLNDKHKDELLALLGQYLEEIGKDL